MIIESPHFTTDTGCDRLHILLILRLARGMHDINYMLLSHGNGILEDFLYINFERIGHSLLNNV